MATVYVLTYCYRHGETTSVYSTEAKAHRAAAQIVAEYIDEVHRPPWRRDIAKALNVQDYGGALEIWGQYQCEVDSDESMSICPCEVDDDLGEAPITVSLKGKTR